MLYFQIVWLISLYFQIQEEIPEIGLPYLVHRIVGSNDQETPLSMTLSHREQQDRKQTRTSEPLSGQKTTVEETDLGISVDQSATNTNLNAAKNPKDKTLNLPLVSTIQHPDYESDSDCAACPEGPLYLRYQHLCRKLSNYLESGSDEYFKHFKFPEKFYKTFCVMDIVTEGARNSCCFTKR